MSNKKLVKRVEKLEKNVANLMKVGIHDLLKNEPLDFDEIFKNVLPHQTNNSFEQRISFDECEPISLEMLERAKENLGYKKESKPSKPKPKLKYKGHELTWIHCDEFPKAFNEWAAYNEEYALKKEWEGLMEECRSKIIEEQDYGLRAMFEMVFSIHKNSSGDINYKGDIEKLKKILKSIK